MLNNLKLGSMTEDMTLTHDNTNLPDGATYTLPRIDNDQTGYDYGIPRVYSFWDDTTSPQNGSVKSDGIDRIDITRDDFYGYHYNWCAATASNTNDPTCLSSVSADATQDICPANWRLPKGGEYNDPNNEFAQLTAAMAGESFDEYVGDFNWGSPYSDNFQFGGPFQGVFAGTRNGSSWYYQGGSDGGYWWSSTHSSSNSAISLKVSSGNVIPSSYNNRHHGLAVRCLLQ
jgi:uncharacterized protein (TIGR02145 family)